ncbi:MAG: hypothetical protein II336_10345 [Loktanella sp.]|nr:hypothetical protein [Loktanella sp.]
MPAPISRSRNGWRVAPEAIAVLNRIAWWDGGIDRIAANDAAIVGADLAALEKVATG